MKTLLLTLSFVMFSSNVFGQDSRVPSLDCVSVQGATVKFRLEEPPLIDCLIITGELSCDGMAVTALNECEHDIVLHAITRAGL